MSNFTHIQQKLQEFLRKYYTNELLKGLILFSSMGLLYFIFTLFIEYFLWLQPTARTILFWVFVFVEIGLLYKYIVIPISKIIGFKKGISYEKASFLIGKHFKEVDDKLLNVLQLNNEANKSELLLASIEQKSKDLEPFPFTNAVNFTSNKKYLKFLALPIIIWFIVALTGNFDLFTDSYKRVVHHQVAYDPPAPFSFIIKNNSLSVIEGESITLNIETEGSLLPEDVRIYFLNQNYLVKNNGSGSFEHTFSSILDPIPFYIESNGVRSKMYEITVIAKPTIIGFEMWLDYPNYTKRKDEQILNTGNAIVPQGTLITWKLNSKNTNKIAFNSVENDLFKLIDESNFTFEKRVFKNIDYQISTSNENLKNFETMNYSIDVVKDAYPKIEVKSDIDSISHGPVQFVGRISDDYNLSKLELIYYNQKEKEIIQKKRIPIKKLGFEEFYYLFPTGIDLVEGIDYELYFEVYDNDAVSGIKSTKSKIFSYYKKTESELHYELLKEQHITIEELDRNIGKSKQIKEGLEEMQKSLLNKPEMNWNDQKKLKSFMMRQKQYKRMMQHQTEELNKNLNEQPKSQNKNLEERKKDIQELLKQAKELDRKEELMKELKEMAAKLNKEGLTEKLKELTEKNRQNERSLERILELTKRFYIEQKANQISDKLEELSKKQDALSEDVKNSSEKQKELNDDFKDLEKELNELDKENNKLQQPLKLSNTSKEEKEIENEMNKAKEKLENSESEKGNGKADQQSEKKSATKNQKSAAQKMKQMSKEMQGAMQSMQGETMDEDIEMLRAILENLIEFSFQQEALIGDFTGIENSHPDFSDKLRKQHVLREYFEHIDDSLYTLSMRQPKIGTQIFKELADAHYHLEESLIHFSDNQLNVGLSDQHFVMTSTNNIAYLLSNILNSMQNSSPSMGKGKGDSFSLPDIIQKQGETIDKMGEEMKKNQNDGKKPGEEGEKKPGENGTESGKGGAEETNGALYEIYKQQSELRNLLEDALKDKKGKEGNGIGENALKQMEQLEKDLLEKGFSNDVLQKMMLLKHELLKLQEATYEQGNEEKRESNTNQNEFERRTIDDVLPKKLWFNQNEILNRQSLPLRTQYKKRVQEYFKVNDSIQ